MFSSLNMLNEANVQLGHVTRSLHTNSIVDTENYFCVLFYIHETTFNEIKSTQYSEKIF